MRILRSYVLREHIGPFLATAGGLTAVLLIGNIVKFAELIISKGVSPLDILRLLLYLVPYLLNFTVPMACLVAMVMAFSRLNADYELIAMRASGVAPARLIAPALTLAMVISVALLALSNRVIPESHLAFRRQLKVIGVKHPTAYLEAGRFIKAFTPYVIFIYQLEGQTLIDVRIYEPRPDGPTRTIIATRGKLEPLPTDEGVKLTLFDGHIDEWDPEHPGSLYKVAFKTYTMTLNTAAADANRIEKKLKEMTFDELSSEQSVMEAEGIDPRPIQLERHRRIGSSFATLVFVLFGLSIGLAPYHHERLVTFVWVLGLFIVYYLATVGSTALALKGWLPPWLVMWTPNLGIGTFAATRVWRAVRG
jgi:lipopolysaccharide export system permease protein